MYTIDTVYKIDTNKNLLYSSGSSNLVLQMNVKSRKVLVAHSDSLQPYGL